MKLLYSACTLALAVIANAQDKGLTVQTQQGDVVGTQVSPGVRRFLGIPFAVAQRWEAPQLPPHRNEPFVAAEFGPSCPQAISPSNNALLHVVGFRGGLGPESEDCLSINVWAPSVNREQKTAVMLWVYGGGFQFGFSNTPIYDGQTLVENHADVTVVSFNYRLNVLGQPNAPQLYSKTQSQNFGLLDVDAAVQWVYDNIAAFGGDPERIVLFGQSAGGIAIDAYTYAHPQDKRIKGVIEQSGNLKLPYTGAYNSTFDPSLWSRAANAVGCGNGKFYTYIGFPQTDLALTVTENVQLNCLKRVPYRILVDTVVSNNLTFNPVADGITIFADTNARAAAGNFLHVPLLNGATAQESDIFVISSQLAAIGYTIPVLTELLADLSTQIIFACPTAQTANDRFKAGVRSWRYQYQGVFRNLTPKPDLRAYHSSDIPIVFGNFGNGTQSEVALSKYMQGAWVAFARDPVNGLAYYGWPLYNPNTTSLAQLGGFYNETGVVFTIGSLVDFTCDAPDTLATVLGQLLGDAAGSIF